MSFYCFRPAQQLLILHKPVVIKEARDTEPDVEQNGGFLPVTVINTDTTSDKIYKPSSVKNLQDNLQWVAAVKNEVRGYVENVGTTTQELILRRSELLVNHLFSQMSRHLET